MKKYPFPKKISLSLIEKHQNDDNIRSFSMETWSFHRNILFSVAEFGNLVIRKPCYSLKYIHGWWIARCAVRIECISWIWGVIVGSTCKIRNICWGKINKKCFFVFFPDFFYSGVDWIIMDAGMGRAPGDGVLILFGAHHQKDTPFG